MTSKLPSVWLGWWVHIFIALTFLRRNHSVISFSNFTDIFLCRQTSCPRVLPLLILVPTPRLPLLHPRNTLISLVTVLIPVFVTHAADSSSVRGGTAHGVELALPLTLDGTDGVVDDLLGCADAAVDFMVPD